MMNAIQLAADAVRADAWTIMERLLESDSQFAHASVVDGNTLLHVAAFFGAVNSAAVLLQHGAEPMRVNAAGQTAVDLAFLNGHVALVAKLRTGPAVLSSTAPTSIAAHTDGASEFPGSTVGVADCMSLAGLPLDVVVRILSCLDVHSVLACSRTCRKLGKALEDRWLWECLCWQHWRCDSVQARRGLCTWKDVYKEQCICHRAQQRLRERRERPPPTMPASDAPPVEAEVFTTPKLCPLKRGNSVEELFQPLFQL